MTRVSPEAIESVVARLTRHGAPAAWVRAVRLGIRSAGECDVELDRHTTAVVRASARVPGHLDVTLVHARAPGREAGTVVLAASTSAEAENANPRRSVRVSDALWAEAATHGKPSTIMVEALEAWLSARRKR